MSFLRAVFARESVPEELITDNGPAFRSQELGDFLSRHGVRRVFSSPYSPQTCGLVERFNRTVKGAIQSARLAGVPRPDFLRDFLLEYRTTPHPATGVTPFLAMRGREARTSVDVLPVPEPEDTSQRVRRVKRRFRRHQAQYKDRHDRVATAPPAWRVGDWVRVRKPVTGRVEGQRSVQVDRRTGPLSYRLSTGERTHARRLVVGRPDGGVWEEDPDLRPETFFPAPKPNPVSVRGGSPPVITPPPVSSPTVVTEALEAPPLRDQSQSAVEAEASEDPPRRSGRESRPPDRYTPSKY